MEEAEYEKDGEVRRYRKVRLTDAGGELRAGWADELLLSDGVVEEFGGGEDLVSLAGDLRFLFDQLIGGILHDAIEFSGAALAENDGLQGISGGGEYVA